MQHHISQQAHLSEEYYFAGSYDSKVHSTIVYRNPDSEVFEMESCIGITPLSLNHNPDELLELVAAFLNRYSANESIILRGDDYEVMKAVKDYNLSIAYISCVEILPIKGVDNVDRFAHYIAAHNEEHNGDSVIVLHMHIIIDRWFSNINLKEVGTTVWLQRISKFASFEAVQLICAVAEAYTSSFVFAPFNKVDEKTYVKYNNYTYSIYDSDTTSRSSIFIQITLRRNDFDIMHVEAFELFVCVTPENYHSVQTVHGEPVGLTDPARASSIKCDHPITVCGFLVDTLEVSNQYFYTHRAANDNCYVDPRKLVWIKEACGPCLSVINQWGCENTFRVHDDACNMIKVNLENIVGGYNRSSAEVLVYEILHTLLDETAKGFDIFK